MWEGLDSHLQRREGCSRSLFWRKKKRLRFILAFEFGRLGALISLPVTRQKEEYECDCASQYWRRLLTWQQQWRPCFHLKLIFSSQLPLYECAFSMLGRIRKSTDIPVTMETQFLLPSLCLSTSFSQLNNFLFHHVCLALVIDALPLIVLLYLIKKKHCSLFSIIGIDRKKRDMFLFLIINQVGVNEIVSHYIYRNS